MRVTVQELAGVNTFRGDFRRFGMMFRFFIYHVDGLLIDTGPLCGRREVTAFADAYQPQKIVLTHYHEDHTGNAAWLAERYQSSLFMSEKTSKIIENPPRIPFYRRRVWGQMEPAVGESLGERIKTEHHHFRLLPTPGHSQDHIALIEEEQGWLFTGDLFLATQLKYGMREESVGDHIRSLKKVLSYPIKTVFCSHAGVVPNGHEALSKKLHYLEELQARTRDLRQQGYSVQEIARRLLSRKQMVEWFSGGEMSPVHLIQSIVTEDGGG